MQVAYLAPEIPALSATFVYHEILALEKLGFSVFPVSVRAPAVPATEEPARALALRTVHLYSTNPFALAGSVLACLFRHPLRWFSALGMVLADMVSLGVFNRTSLGLGFRFLAASRLSRLLTAHKCLHLHVHFAHVPTDIAMYAARMSGIPFSFTSHANDLFERGWLLGQKVRRSVKAVTISDFNRKFLESKGAPPEKILIVRCGVDEALFTGTPPESRAVPVIGSLGRLVEKKGFDTLLRAAGILFRAGKDFRISLAGYGPMEEELRALAEKEGLGPAVQFLGPLSNDQVPGWLAGLDVFALACRRDSRGDMDGIPVVLMEAMAARVAVVSTSISAIPELVADGVGGLVVPPADPEALAAALSRLLVSPELRKTLAQGGHDKVMSEFTEAVNARKLGDLFRSSAGLPR